MSLFLLTFFLVYGGIHAYAFLRLRQAIPFGPAAGLGIAALFGAMVLAPLLVRVAERHEHESLARFLALTGYGWMGVVFLFFSAGIALDLYRLLVVAAGWLLNQDLARFAPSAAARFWLPLLVSCGASLYGWLEARDIRLERVTIASPKIPAAIGRLTVVQISDVHVGLIVREERLRRMIARIREARPDLLVSTGDLVDGQLAHLNGLADLLREVQPRYGGLAITGNHEFYAGLGQSLDFTRNCGFRVLRGEAATVADILTVAGVDDPAGSRTGANRTTTEETLLATLPANRFTLLLKHRPVVAPGSIGRFDLQLSGHVHKGQIFPFNLLTHLQYPVRMGLSRISSASSLYVSRGTGTWGPPIRLFAPPEVTVIELVSSPPS